MDRADLFPDQWVYVHEPGLQVGRIQNFNNWSAELAPDPQTTCVAMEYFCTEGDDLWSTPDERLLELAACELAALGLAERRDVADGLVVREPAAYPVYDRDYAANVRAIRDYLSGIPNLQTIGRNGMHRYNNMDDSMLAGILAAREAAGRGRRPVDRRRLRHGETMTEAPGSADAVTLTPTPKRAGSAARGTVLLSIGQVTRSFSGAALYIIAGRLLPADAFGRFAVVFITLSWAGVVLESIVLPGLQKAVSEDERRLRPALWFALRWYVPAALAFGAAGCAAAPALAVLLEDRRLTLLFVLAAAQLPLLGVVKLASNLLAGIQHYVAAAVVRIVYNTPEDGGRVLLLLSGRGRQGAVAGLGAGTLLAAVASTVLLLATARRLPGSRAPGDGPARGVLDLRLAAGRGGLRGADDAGRLARQGADRPTRPRRGPTPWPTRSRGCPRSWRSG